MGDIKQIELPDGTVIHARVISDEDDQAGGDAGLGDYFKLEKFGDTVKGVAASVRQSVSGLRADKVSVEFGLELSVDAHGVMAVLASGGAKASVKIKLDWELDARDAGDQAAG
ncbi:CU044_2847 family protein [Nocardia sp. NPDC059246]|uniref:CU044_2847 family protein n=1 Tax=unclassified Nocardia TaxID=2637762 RepID=UPI0036B1EC3A